MAVGGSLFFFLMHPHSFAKPTLSGSVVGFMCAFASLWHSQTSEMDAMTPNEPHAEPSSHLHLNSTDLGSVVWTCVEASQRHVKGFQLAPDLEPRPWME